MLLVEFRGEKSQAKTAEIKTYAHFRTLHEMLPGYFCRRAVRYAPHHHK